MKNIEEVKLKRGQLYWYILEVIGITLVSGGNPLRPVIPLAIKEIINAIKKIKNINVKEKKIINSLKSLEKKEIINIEEKNDNIFVKLIDKENPTIIKYSIKAILDFKKKEKVWKRQWFMVFFDVPEIQRNKRDYLHNYLQKIGFYRYQQSVYIFPYECEREINLIKKIVEGVKYIKYIVANSIEDEERIKAYFKI